MYIYLNFTFAYPGSTVFPVGQKEHTLLRQYLLPDAQDLLEPVKVSFPTCSSACKLASTRKAKPYPPPSTCNLSWPLLISQEIPRVYCSARNVKERQAAAT